MSKLKRLRKNKGAIAADRFEQKCLLAGFITEKSKGGRPKEVDFFDQLEAEVVAELGSEYTQERDQTIADGDQVIDEAVRNAKRKQKGA